MATSQHLNDKRLLELLERWQSGDFSRADERELQALTDSDAFRKEAVEGFWVLPEADHAQHLAALRKRLRARTGGSRRIALMPLLAAVAAIGILVLAVIWLMPGVEKSAPMAQESATQAEPPPAQVMTEAAPAPEPSAQPAAGQQTAGKASAAGPPPAGSIAPVKAAAPRFDSVNQGADYAASRAAERREEKSAEKPVLSDQEFAKAADKEAEEVLDDRPGNALSRAAAKKQSETPAKDAQKMKTAPADTKSKPQGGWNNFQDYLRKNARLPEEARQNNVSGSVRLKFRLDEQNQPQDFQILRSLGHGCEAEAIRLIKAYSWQRGEDTDLILDIPFVR